MILRDLQDLPEFIIDEHNLNNVSVDGRKEIERIIWQDSNRKKRLTVNCKTTDNRMYDHLQKRQTKVWDMYSGFRNSIRYRNVAFKLV